MHNASQIVKAIKANDQDHEWYPTTAEMIRVVKNHLSGMGEDKPAVLDCGAGDGRVLNALTQGKQYSIEKSSQLRGLQSPSIIPAGVEFHQTTLIDKAVDVVFSNPPYSEYECWAEKIIKEANAKRIYLIIPERWVDSKKINTALEYREFTATSLFQGNFLEAERSARAKINIVFISPSANKYGSTRTTDSFNLWFDQAFPPPADDVDNSKKSTKEKIKAEVISGRNLIDVLVQLYQKDIDRLQKNYTAATQLDPDLMAELHGMMKGSNSTLREGLMESIKLRIKGLKTLYWSELFSHYSMITERLTTNSREKLLDRINNNTSVDFSAENAYSITQWVLKNANHYQESQLIDLVERMTKQANVSLYASNKKTFGAEDWRYLQKPMSLTHYQLEYRIVLENMGKIYQAGDWHSYDYIGGLNKRGHEFIGDILAVAHTLGWAVENDSMAREWESNKAQDFVNTNGEKLMSVKAFKNGNFHIKLNQKFIKKLNIEFGRLKGWLKDWRQAATETGVPTSEAQSCYGSLQAIEKSALPMLTN